MKRFTMTAALALALSIPTFAGEVPTGGKTDPPPPPTTQTTTQTTSTSTTTNVVTSILLTLVSLIR